MIRYFEQRGHAVDGLIIKIIPFAAAAKALPYWVEHRSGPDPQYPDRAVGPRQ